MTEFIRTMWQSTNVNPSTSTDSTIKMETKPLNQIQIPVPSTSMSLSMENMVERQRLINVNLPEHSNPLPPSATIGRAQAQRAARRDVVNARRDKRKASSPASSSSIEDEEEEEEEEDNQSKRIRTGPTSSIAVIGGLATSERPPTVSLDSAGEERIRAMEAQLETLDPDSKEAKKKRRLIRNRMSAQLHRERKKAYVGQLEDQLMEKDREVQVLQQQLAQMMQEREQMKTRWNETEKQTKLQLAQAEAKAQAATSQLAEQVKQVPNVLDVQIKEEISSWDAPWPVTTDHSMVDALDFSGLDVPPPGDDFLLGSFDNPFAGFGDSAEIIKPHVEIHAAKKNVAMMMAVMFSVGFFGNSSSFYNAAAKSNFSSAFEANQSISQMSIASRIVASLEQTSWKNFRDISSWIAAQTGIGAKETTEEEEQEVLLVTSPSAASDITDSCTSPAMEPSESLNMDGIDGFEYPVDDSSFASVVVSEEPWLNTTSSVHKDGLESKIRRASLTTRLYETLTTLWKEKNQVLLTVFNHRQEVIQRTLADMSSLRQGFASGDFFSPSKDILLESRDQSVSFLYPMSVFTAVDGEEGQLSRDDAVFLEISCHLNTNRESKPVAMSM